jgi:hypothetical protein
MICFDGIMKVVNQFADEVVEQRAQEKMPTTGRIGRTRERKRRILRPKRSEV